MQLDGLIFTDLPEFDKGRQVWERHSFESHAAYRLFQMYRDQKAPRSLSRLLVAADKPKSYRPSLARFRKKHAWDYRIKEHERWLKYQKAVERQRQDDEMARTMLARHNKISLTLQRLASVELSRYVYKLQAHVDNPDQTIEPYLTIDQIQRVLDFATKLERLTRGEPNEITENRQADANDRLRRVQQLAANPKAMAAVKALELAIDNAGNGNAGNGNGGGG